VTLTLDNFCARNGFGRTIEIVAKAQKENVRDGLVWQNLASFDKLDHFVNN